jgi:acetate kinase
MSTRASEQILTLNAGSSSMKFGAYAVIDDEPVLRVKGQVEGIGTTPHFVAKSPEGQLLAESHWEPTAGAAGHVRALMLGGRSQETTMGLSALDGVPMGTRCGALDPGVLLFLMREDGLGVEGLERLLYKESVLRGLSEVSSDLRDLHKSNDPRAAEAIDYFAYRIGQSLGALCAALCGLDALVFTAGIGENDAALRARIGKDAAWLGVEIDEAANTAGAQRISPAGKHPSAWVIPTDEELMIARHTLRVVRQN